MPSYSKPTLSPPVPIYWALTCAVDQLYARGFGRHDCDRYAAWKRGVIMDPPVGPEEAARFDNVLSTMVILTDLTP